MFEDCEMVRTITVETNRLEMINKHLRKYWHARSKMRYRFSCCGMIIILFKNRFKGGKRY